MSPLPFELFLALRYLRPKRTFVSVVTLISIIGVTLGVAVLIIVISVMTGFDRQLKSRILGFNAHLKLHLPQSRPMTGYRDLMKTIRQSPHVTGVAPFVLMPVLLERAQPDGLSNYWSPWIRGIDPDLEESVSILPQSIIRGNFDLRGNSLLLGLQLAQRLGVDVGDEVLVHSPENFRRMKESLERDETLEAIPPDLYHVTGIFDVGYFEYNMSFVICSLGNSQDLSGFEQDAVHGLQIMIDDPFQAEVVRQELRARIAPEYRIRTWSEENSTLLDALMVEKNVMFYILFFIMVVAAFGIMGTLIAFVVQKTREIGILKALGAGNFQVMGLFLSQSVLVGVIGVAAGFGLGMTALHYRNEFLHFMNRLTGFELFPAAIYNFTELPAMIVPHDILIICGTALGMCLLAGVIPAWNAGRLKPVEALRHE